MYESMNVGSLTQLNMDETLAITGGGLVSLFLSCIGIAVTPVVTCLCPPAGIGLGFIAGGVFINNWPY